MGDSANSSHVPSYSTAFQLYCLSMRNAEPKACLPPTNRVQSEFQTCPGASSTGLRLPGNGSPPYPPGHAGCPSGLDSAIRLLVFLIAGFAKAIGPSDGQFNGSTSAHGGADWVLICAYAHSHGEVGMRNQTDQQNARPQSHQQGNELAMARHGPSGFGQGLPNHHHHQMCITSLHSRMGL